MKYRLLYIFVFFGVMTGVQAVYGQAEIRLDSNFEYEIGFQLEGASSGTLNNAMLNASGFIDENLKDENLKRLSDLNYGGNFLDGKIFYRQSREKMWGMKKMAVYVALEWHYLSDYRFTEDLYRLVFYGNKDFAGQKAKLGNSAYRQINYYQIKAGLEHKSANEKHNFGFRLALNLGNSWRAYQFADPSCLYTTSTGAELILKGDINYYESDTAKSLAYQIAGYGTGLDIFYEFAKKKSFKLRFEMANLGFISWDKNTINFEHRGEISFKGIEVNNIFELADNSPVSEDTLMNFVYANSFSGKKMLYTPTDFNLEFRKYFMSGRVEASARIYYRLFSYMLPLYRLDATYTFRNHLKLGPLLSYGAYTSFNAGLLLEWEFARHYYLKLETQYLTGFAQHSFSGMGGFINFTYKF